MNLNYELYKVFYYVSKHLSFSKAAKDLYISQSAVSQSIKILEEKTNTKLFTRHTKKVFLTTEGKQLFHHIEKAMYHINLGEKTIEQLHTLGKGEVHIGVSDTICKYYLLPFLKAFHIVYPDIKIKITNRPSPVCVLLVQNGEVDLSIVNLSQESNYENLYVHTLKETKDIFIASKTFENLKDKNISIKELKNYPLLLLEKNSTTRISFESFIKEHGVDLYPEFELGSMDLLIELSKIGLGIALVMEGAAKEAIKKEEVFAVTIQEPLPIRSIGMLSHKNIPQSIAVKKFIDLLYQKS
ncbi:LysR family transcriptional regulator [Lutibacter sp. B2]|nr:LysR family transcriptional regulator [Lutibacter sp. B2]